MKHAEQTGPGRSHRRPGTEDFSEPAKASADRPDAKVQSKLAAPIVRSPTVRAQRALIDGIHNSPRMVAQRKQIRSIFSEPAQFKDGPGDEQSLQLASTPLHTTGATVQRVRAKKFTEEQSEYDRLKAEFDTFVTAGKKLYANMQQRLTVEESDLDTSKEFGERYNTKPEQDQPPDQAVKKPAFGMKYKTASKGTEATAYENYMNVRGGVMGASYNFNTYDKNEKAMQLPNSEILWNQYKMDAEQRGGEVRGLNEIWRLSIASNAQKVFAMCDVRLSQRSTGKRFDPPTDEFYALLATDNCKGISFMVTQHKQALGGKAIVGITAATEAIIIHLG